MERFWKLLIFLMAGVFAFLPLVQASFDCDSDSCTVAGCDRGLFIITNMAGQPLESPLIRSTRSYVTFNTEDSGRVKVLLICFKPDISVEREVVSVSQASSFGISNRGTVSGIHGGVIVDIPYKSSTGVEGRIVLRQEEDTFCNEERPDGPGNEICKIPSNGIPPNDNWIIERHTCNTDPDNPINNEWGKENGEYFCDRYGQNTGYEVKDGVDDDATFGINGEICQVQQIDILDPDGSRDGSETYKDYVVWKANEQVNCFPECDVTITGSCVEDGSNWKVSGRVSNWNLDTYGSPELYVHLDDHDGICDRSEIEKRLLARSLSDQDNEFTFTVDKDVANKFKLMGDVTGVGGVYPWTDDGPDAAYYSSYGGVESAVVINKGYFWKFTYDEDGNSGWGDPKKMEDAWDDKICMEGNTICPWTDGGPTAAYYSNYRDKESAVIINKGYFWKFDYEEKDWVLMDGKYAKSLHVAWPGASCVPDAPGGELCLWTDGGPDAAYYSSYRGVESTVIFNKGYFWKFVYSGSDSTGWDDPKKISTAWSGSPALDGKRIWSDCGLTSAYYVSETYDGDKSAVVLNKGHLWKFEYGSGWTEKYKIEDMWTSVKKTTTDERFTVCFDEKLVECAARECDVKLEGDCDCPVTLRTNMKPTNAFTFDCKGVKCDDDDGNDLTASLKECGDYTFDETNYCSVDGNRVKVLYMRWDDLHGGVEFVDTLSLSLSYLTSGSSVPFRVEGYSKAGNWVKICEDDGSNQNCFGSFNDLIQTLGYSKTDATPVSELKVRVIYMTTLDDVTLDSSWENPTDWDACTPTSTASVPDSYSCSGTCPNFICDPGYNARCISNKCDCVKSGTGLQNTCEPTGTSTDVKKIDIESCTGSGDLFVYKGRGNLPRTVNTDFTVSSSHDELVVFTKGKPDSDEVFNLRVLVGSNSLDLEEVQIPGDPGRAWKIKIYKVDLGDSSSDRKVTIRGQGPIRGVQGYIAQNSQNPVYDLNTLDVTLGKLNEDIKKNVYLKPGSYNLVFFDKYTQYDCLNDETDDRSLSAYVKNSTTEIESIVDTKVPVPGDVEGVVVMNFDIAQAGDYEYVLNTEDSVYWPISECPAPAAQGICPRASVGACPQYKIEGDVFWSYLQGSSIDVKLGSKSPDEISAGSNCGQYQDCSVYSYDDVGSGNHGINAKVMHSGSPVSGCTDTLSVTCRP